VLSSSRRASGLAWSERLILRHRGARRSRSYSYDFATQRGGKRACVSVKQLVKAAALGNGGAGLARLGRLANGTAAYCFRGNFQYQRYLAELRPSPRDISKGLARGI
jgi:hypothetical protein